MTIEPKAQQCIDACNRCIPAAHDCLVHHVGEAQMKRCLQLCLDCTALC